ncbi:MAG: SpoIIE family protein phosphatase [Firmicutes bacterium]|nr:SpoIIE family protein phosphatase [Bacillota bacterium]
MDKNFWMRWGISGTLALASGYTVLFDRLYPCPAALMAAVVNGKNRGEKMLILSLFSLFLNRRHGLVVWADMIGTAAAWMAVLWADRRKAAPAGKAAAASVVFSAGKVLTLWNMNMMYRYGFETAISEAVLIVAFTYIFYKLFAFIRLGKLPLTRPEGILILTGTATILLKGILSPAIGILPEPLCRFQVVRTGLFLLTLWIGYSGGVKEGAVAGVSGGTLLSAVSSASPSVATVLACGGMAAGLCGNESKLLAAISFSAVSLFFGLTQDIPFFNSPAYVPLLASVLFFLLPETMDRKMRSVLSVEDLRSGYNLVSRQYVLQTLENYQRTFQYLSRAYILQRETFHEEPHLRSGRMIMAYQFKGMADAVERLSSDIRNAAVLPLKKERRIRIRVGKAGVAVDGQVSGDSVYYGEIRRGCFAVALSDGMGSGRRAAEESNLTVQTIYRLLAAGFQAELALRIMNSILLYRAGDEIYSTLDLALIDEYTGSLQLYKTGASLTLIKRNDRVEVIKIPALPMGIVGDIPVPSMEYKLKPGDQILLLSDGVAEAGRGQGIQWLTETISGLSSSDPQTVADLLIYKATEHCDEKEKDDMTAVVIVVR